MALNDVFANTPRPQKIAAGVIGLVVLAALGYFLLSPKGSERDALRQRNDALTAEVTRARTDEINLRPFRAQAETLRRRLEAAKSRLPLEREIPGLYRQLSDLALESGLAVALFTSKPAEDRDTVSEIPISLTAEGTYHQLAAFFSRMGKIARIVNLGDFRLAGIERPTGSLRAELTLATYLFRAEGSPPPASAAAKPGAPVVPTPAIPPVAPGPQIPGAGR
jgi:type IV pilus assembly protein PilO